MVEADTMIEKNEDGIFLTVDKWSATERRLFYIDTKKHKPFRAFERNYSKWTTFNISKLEDIKILGTYGKGVFLREKGDHLIEIKGDSYIEESEDTYYESWVGNLDVKKQFENSEYNYEFEVFLENDLFTEKGHSHSVRSDMRAVMPKEDYPKLKEMF